MILVVEEEGLIERWSETPQLPVHEKAGSCERPHGPYRLRCTGCGFVHVVERHQSDKMAFRTVVLDEPLVAVVKHAWYRNRGTGVLVERMGQPVDTILIQTHVVVEEQDPTI